MREPLSKKLNALSWVTCFWLAIEMARLQDIVKGFASLRPGLILGSIILMLWVVHRKELLFGSRKVVLFLGFIALGIPGAFVAVNHRHLFDTLLSLLTYTLVFFLVMPALITEPTTRTRILTMLGLCFSTISIYALVHGGIGPGGHVGDENDLSLAVNVGACFAFFLMRVYRDSRLRRWFWGVTLLLCISASVTSLSRGGFLGLAAGILVVAYLKRAVVRTVLISGAVIAVATALFASTFLKEVESIADVNDNTRLMRYYHWSIGWEMFKDHPVVGVGFNNYPWRAGDYENDPDIAEKNIWGRSFAGRASHSTYFQLIPETGVIGFVIYFLLVYKGGISAYRLANSRLDSIDPELRALAFGVVGGLVSFSVAAMFVSALYYPIVWLLIGMSIAFDRVASPSNHIQAQSRPNTCAQVP